MDDAANPQHVAAATGTDSFSTPATNKAAPIAGDVRTNREQVPYIGMGWRWYDIPYRALDFLFTRRRSWPKLPRRVRSAVNRVRNDLAAFNHLDRARIRHAEKPLWNLWMPEGERVSLPYMWLVEFYSPSHASELARRLGRRKWQHADFTRPEVPNRIIRDGRERQDPLGWHSVATILPPDSSDWMPGAVHSKIPSEFRSISISLLPLGSALTAVVAQFRLTQDAALALDTTVRKTHAPELYRAKGRLQVRERMFVGIRDVRQVREGIHDSARSWFARELPGLFAIEGNVKHPAMDLLFTQRYDPFNASHDPEGSNFRRAVGLATTPWSLTYSDTWKNILLQDRIAEWGDEDGSDPAWMLTARFDKALGKKAAFQGGRSVEAIAAELDDGAPALMTRIGLFELLRVKHEQASRARDQAVNRHSGRPVTSSRNLRNSVLGSSLDMATIADDIQRLAGDRERYEFLVPKLASRRISRGTWSDPDPNVLEQWAARQRDSAMRLLELDERLLEILGLASNLNASMESIRSQRWSLIVALLSLASSAAAVWLAYLAIAK